MRTLRFLPGVLAAVAFGCASTQSGPPVVGPGAAVLDVGALADELTPQEMTPVTPLIPTLLTDAMERAVGLGSRSPEDIEAWLADTGLTIGDLENADYEGALDGLVILGMLVYGYEGLAARTDDGWEKYAPELNKYYSHVLFLLSPPLRRILVAGAQASVGGIRESGQGDIATAVEELVDRLDPIAARAKTMWAMTISHLLRSDDPSLVSRALSDVIALRVNDGECDGATAIAREQVRREPNNSVFWARLAIGNYRDGDVEAGDAALKASEENAGASPTDDLTEALTEALRLRQEVQELVSGETADALHRRAAFSHHAGCSGRAATLWDQLVTAHPKDARGYLGKAWIEYATSGDAAKAIELLRGALEYEHRDEDFYATAVGLHAFQMVGILGKLAQGTKKEHAAEFWKHRQSITPFLEGLREYQADRVASLELVHDAMGRMLPNDSSPASNFRGTARIAQRQAMELRKQFPNSVPVYKMAAASLGVGAQQGIRLEPDDQLAFFTEPLPELAPEDSPLAASRLMLYMSLFRTAVDKELVQSLLDDVPASTAAYGVADQVVHIWNAFEVPEHWGALPLNESGEELSDEWTRALINNAFVATRLAGSEELNPDLLKLLSQESPNALDLNLWVTFGPHQPESQLRALGSLANQADAAIVRQGAMRWLAHLAAEAGRDEDRDRWLCEAEALGSEVEQKVAKENEKAQLTFEGTFQTGFGLEGMGELKMEFNTVLTPWLILRAPHHDVPDCMGEGAETS